MPARKPFPLWDAMPAVLRDVIVDFHWDLERLWQLDLSVTRVPVAALRWHFDLPMWQYEGAHFAVSPAEVAADPIRYREQWDRTMAADLRHPLHVLVRPDRLTVLDGVHRLLKAHHLGHPTVAVHQVPLERLETVAVTT